MDPKIVQEFSRLRVLNNAAPISGPPSPNKNKKLNMEALVHDLNQALELDETGNLGGAAGGGNNSSNNASSTSNSRRRAWRRRCKSTSNLSALNSRPSKGVGGGSVDKKSHNNSEDSSSSTDDNCAVILTADRGTSSLQLTDSEDEANITMGIVPTSGRGGTPIASGSKLTHSQSTRRKNFPPMPPSLENGGSKGARSKKLNVESDSVNENLVRPSTKRKRKFKRMALDPDTTPNPNPTSANAMDVSQDGGSKSKTGTIKRKKVRSRSACEAPQPSPSTSGSKKKGASSHAGTMLASKSQKGSFGGRQRQLSATVVPGKRKRSSREKSLEPDPVLVNQSAIPSHAAISEEPSIISDLMDCEMENEDDDASRRSSSSLSSSEWEENERGTDDSSRPLAFPEDDGEADDEQSDWPGYEGSNVGSGGCLTDDEQDLDLPDFSEMALLSSASDADPIENFQSLTSTARQTYLARMKRLADCVPGREIRAGSRKLRNPQSGFIIKSSSSEQLSRFLQDSSRTELRLTVLRPADRNKIAQMANLYSLQLRYEGPNILVLAKTGKTVRVDCFIVPKTPASKPVHPVDAKRRRRTPPPTVSTDVVNAMTTGDSMEFSGLVGAANSGALTDSPTIDERTPPSDETRRQSN